MSFTSAFSGGGAAPVIASQAEAEAGTDNAKSMTPLRTAEAIAALASSGGSTILRAKGTLSSYTDGGSFPTPGHGTFACYEWTPGAYGTVTITVAGTNYVMTVSQYDPGDGSYFIDASLFTGGADLANAIASALPGWLSGIVTNVQKPDNTTVTFDTVVTGSGATLVITPAASGFDPSSTNGVDGVAPSGGTQAIDLIAADGSKTLKPVRIWAYSEDQSEDSLGVGTFLSVRLRVGASDYEIALINADSLGGVEALPFLLGDVNSVAEYWLDGVASAKLTALLTTVDGYEFGVGGQVTVYALCEQY